MSSDSSYDDWDPYDAVPDVKPETSDKCVSTESDQDRNIICCFCTRKIHETEKIVVLSVCGDMLCPNCFNMFAEYPNRRHVCPLCFKDAPEFD